MDIAFIVSGVINLLLLGVGIYFKPQFEIAKITLDQVAKLTAALSLALEDDKLTPDEIRKILDIVKNVLP